MSKQIQEYRIIDHGIVQTQMFQGQGTAFTDFEDCATGIGLDAKEAFNDALEQLAQNDWNTANAEDGCEMLEHRTYPEIDAWNDVFYHVSVLVK